MEELLREILEELKKLNSIEESCERRQRQQHLWSVQNQKEKEYKEALQDKIDEAARQFITDNPR